ncbi:DegT/DnrJ/EryC1/StrS family aminotransferase [Amphiplicatus metriothermophilus]|uniref:dTDP-4-amino-4,6-dideoxygalactose transaminase n=1 Tax=Amphiplicatus metriothermophilus TaxID=1519374 RepID=A0A239PJ13_9PROT|nr:DegT/DnrJ/EryC1/StrS family aminotransferase [Amphiplicatus metriothermophilus]MBB5517874.1 dTDP-4-amino-4,6-dideoxygalactose transaminase [Amphiplicatus metriothermophilus]SNT67792.1 dTDP-4-amino-4,6-dideoxygalactose transaminase [Amphiplicatus metriothermophilus]
MNGVANLPLAGTTRVGEIAFIDLKAQQRIIRERIESRLKRVLDHGKYIAGPEVEELEEALAARTGAKGAVACASGTAALIIPMLAQGVDVGDAVFAPSFTYNATVNAILLTGATPVFVDVDPDTFNMDPADLERRIEVVRREGRLRPRAAIPVDLFGAPADYPAISKIAEREGLFLLADGAQSFGARLHGRWVGDLATATATSFFPGKALGAYGDAGAVFTQDESALEAWRSIRWHGTDASRKISVCVGFNGRMDSFQAAVLLEKLAIFDEEQDARARIAAAYDARLSGAARLQALVPGAQSGRSYYSLCAPGRDAIVAMLKEMGVPTAIYYETPLHMMPAFEAFAPAGGLPVTEGLAREIFSLPMHPYLTPAQVDYICEATLYCIDRTR